MGKTFKDDKHKGYKRVNRNVQKELTKDDNQNRFRTKVVPRKRDEEVDVREEVDQALADKKAVEDEMILNDLVM